MGRPLNFHLHNSYRSLSFNLLKWSLIAFIILNILSSIWVGIYMEKAVKRAGNELPDEDGHYSTGDRRTSSKVWKGFVVAILVIIDLVNLIGIFGAIKESYRITLIHGVVLMAYAVFAAVNDYTRGSYTSWIVAFAAAVLAFVFTHKIRTEVLQPTVYTTPATAP